MSNSESQTLAAARIFKALSNPHRLTLFRSLAGCLGVGTPVDTSREGIQQCQLDQARALGLAPSTVSSHYKELRDSGLIRMERRGKHVRCWLDPDALALARSFLDPCPPPGGPASDTE
jgi:ArsR family transcriptional regulator